jgi:hypothetical protein
MIVQVLIAISIAVNPVGPSQPAGGPYVVAVRADTVVPHP